MYVCVRACVGACVCACVQNVSHYTDYLYSQAVSLLEEALEKYADFPKVYNLIAQPITTPLSIHVSQYISVYLGISLCISVYLYICSDVQLWMMRGQIEEQQGNAAAAREFYNKAVSSHDYEEWIMESGLWRVRVESESGEYDVTQKLLESFLLCLVLSPPQFYCSVCIHNSTRRQNGEKQEGLVHRMRRRSVVYIHVG